MTTDTLVRCAVIGYGGAFNMGRHHATAIDSTPGLKTVAVCDLLPERREQARAELGSDVQIYASVDELLARSDADLAVIVTPHNSHAPLALQCLEAGKHVITEKPMCLTVAEATAMIETARRRGVMLTTYHNRRWDGDYLAIRAIVAEGIIGDIFQIETFHGGWHRPRDWWRSVKAISGGLFYDWGAHWLYWVLNLIPGRLRNVTGIFHKRVWEQATNEDHTQAILRWENGACADVQISSIARAPRPKWRILGTKGAILDEGKGQFTVFGGIGDHTAQFEVKYEKSDWPAFYRNVAAHLLRGEPLEITPESARRVIAVIETAERSAQSGQAEPVPYE